MTKKSDRITSDGAMFAMESRERDPSGYDRALEATVALAQPAESVRLVRHKKRGSTYRVIGEGDAQTHDEIMDGDPLVIYQSEQDGRFWVRPKDEFGCG